MGFELSAIVSSPVSPQQKLALTLAARRRWPFLRLPLRDTHPERLVLGGIELESSGETTSRVPVLGRLPLLGWLFRDGSRSAERTRFYVFLRCDVLRNESFRGLRDVTSEAARAAEIEGDVPVLEPRWMR